MSKLLTVAFIAAVGLFGSRLAMGAVSDLQLKNDLTGVPGSTASNQNHAFDIAKTLGEVAEKHDCKPVDSSIEVDHEEPVLRGTPPTTAYWQWVTMKISCVRTHAFFMKRPIVFEIKLEMFVGGGRKEHWPETP